MLLLRSRWLCLIQVWSMYTKVVQINWLVTTSSFRNCLCHWCSKLNIRIEPCLAKCSEVHTTDNQPYQRYDKSSLLYSIEFTIQLSYITHVYNSSKELSIHSKPSEYSVPTLITVTGQLSVHDKNDALWSVSHYFSWSWWDDSIFPLCLMQKWTHS